MSDKSYKKIKNTIIASASSGLVAGMLLVGGFNSVYAESQGGTLPVYSHKRVTIEKPGDFKDKSVNKKQNRGWRKNQA